MQGCCQGSLSLFFAAPAGLLTLGGFGCPQRSLALRRSGKQIELALPRFQVYHLSSTFSSPSQIYRHKSNENRERGEEKLLNSSQEFVASLDISYHYSTYLTSVKHRISAV